MEKIVELLSDLGIDNASEIIQKPDQINTSEISDRIRVNMRAQFTNDTDITGGYIEQGRQNILSEVYEKLSAVYGVPKDEILNKPLDDVFNIAKTKAQASMSKSSKELEDEITKLRQQAHQLETATIPALKQEYLRQISEIQNQYTVKELLTKFQLASEYEVAESYVMRQIFDPTQFKLTQAENGQLLITKPDGKAVRREDKKDAPQLDLKGVIGYLLEKGKLLQMQPEKPKATISTPVATPNNVLPAGIPPVQISPLAIQKQQEMQRKLNERRGNY